MTSISNSFVTHNCVISKRKRPYRQILRYFQFKFYWSDDEYLIQNEVNWQITVEYPIVITSSCMYLSIKLHERCPKIYKKSAH